MTDGTVHKRNRVRELILAAGVAFTTPALIVIYLESASLGRAQTQSRASAEFEVAVIKANKSGSSSGGLRPLPGGMLTATNVSLKTLINMAYRLQPYQLAGAEGWIDIEKFDLTAKAADNPSPESIPVMLQALLKDRFKLAVHHESKEQSIYALVISNNGKTGPKLTRAGNEKCPDLNAAPIVEPCGGFRMGRGTLIGRRVSIQMLVASLSPFMDRQVVDRTNLDGLFDISLEWGLERLPGQLGNNPQAETTVSDG